jgi:hypothetical protein
VVSQDFEDTVNPDWVAIRFGAAEMIRFGTTPSEEPRCNHPGEPRAKFGNPRIGDVVTIERAGTYSDAGVQPRRLDTQGDPGLSLVGSDALAAGT